MIFFRGLPGYNNNNNRYFVQVISDIEKYSWQIIMEGDILNCSLTFTGEQVRKNFFQPIRGLKIFSDTPILLHQIINSQQIKKVLRFGITGFVIVGLFTEVLSFYL